jgi:hypothetical protein
VHIDQPLIRGFRALVFAVVCVAASAGLHFAAGGALIDAPLFAAALLPVTAGAFLLGGRQRGLAAVLAACAAAQAGLHVGFAFSTGHLHHLSLTPLMLTAHALALVVSALWLTRGEAALAAFLDLLVLTFTPALLIRLLDAAGPALPPRPLTGSFERVRPHLLLLASAASRRGPPVALVSQ